MRLKNYIKSLLLFTFLIVGAVMVTDKWVMPFYVSHGEEIPVPNVLNRDFVDAKKILDKFQLSVTKKQRYDVTSVPGQVIQQIPEHRTTIKPGRNVELIIADNDRIVNVPMLKLSTLRDAQFNLESLSLKVGKVDSQASNEFPAGVILEQSIEPNTKVKLGSVLDFVVSAGNNRVEAKVPYLISKSLLDAKLVIVESGLRLGNIVKKYSPELLPGTVISQSLDSSKTVSPLSTIDLTVSSTDAEDVP